MLSFIFGDLLITMVGYGDDNQMRAALVETCREMADFEIVVAPAQRIATSVTHNEYLTRSIRRLGVGKTLLVANKSDVSTISVLYVRRVLTAIRQLLNDLVRAHVNVIGDAPFPEVKKCLKESESLLRAGIEDKHLIKDYRGYALEIAGSAFIEREERDIDRKLRDKGVEVDILLVSARQYSLCLDGPYSQEPPIITAQATGIPRLRQFLLSMPARTNYETLQYHVYETLPDIYSQMQRILTKFVEDAVYAEMRKDLVVWLPTTENSLESSLELLISKSVVKPWDADKAETTIIANLEETVNAFVHPTPYYATFLKFIKENGIPVNGKGKGRNLNIEILDTMKQYIEQWYNQLTGHIAVLAGGLEVPVQIVLRQLRTHLDNLTGHPELKDRANDALETTWRRIGMAQDKLRTDLEARLRATYDNRTTEKHIKSPIALAMVPVYHSVLDVKGGTGAYRRHRNHLRECLCQPRPPMRRFPQIIATDIANAQKESWTQCGREYATEVMALLNRFRDITDELLDSQGYVKADHRECRDTLQTMLPAFEDSIRHVQKVCPRLEGAVDATSNKRKRADE